MKNAGTCRDTAAPSILHFASFMLGLRYRRHSSRYPAGLSSWEKIAERVWSGRVGRTCRFFLLTGFGFCGAGFCHLLRSHCGRYWTMVVIMVSSRLMVKGAKLVES